MTDLFETEQSILDAAINRVNELQNGASCDNDEYISLAKEYRSLLRQLRRVTKISDRTTVDLNASNHELQDKIHYDLLTGIYNKRFLDESLKRIVRSLSRSGEPLSVLMLDVDFFKSYGAAYGRSKADECLKSIAAALCDSLLRADDFASRCDGDEFAVVLPHTDENGAHVMANRILDNIRAIQIPHEKSGVSGCVTVSMGCVTDAAKRKQTGDTYIKLATEALRLSKQNGRNMYTHVNAACGL